MHVLVCKAEGKWAAFLREHSSVGWSVLHAGNVLRAAVEASFGYGFEHALTYSERQADEVMADVAEQPEQLVGVSRAVDLRILAPERRWETDDRWATVLKSTGRSDLWVPGVAFNGFRRQEPNPPVLKEKVLTDFFGFDRPDPSDQTWRTFLPQQKGVTRPHYLRELYLRPQWSARELAPNDFPAFRPGPVITPEQQAQRLAKLPMNRSAAKRAKRAEAHLRIRAAAEERRLLREQAQQEAP